jgi:hypothetical protein
MGRSSGWWIGDWLRFGNEKFGERYVRAARITGLDVQTLMNMVYVASHIEPTRRRETLSFTHHAEVVSLAPAEQDRWLRRAEEERLSARCLREEIRRERRSRMGSSDPAACIGPTAAGRASSEWTCPSCGRPFDERELRGLVAAASPALIGSATSLELSP